MHPMIENQRLILDQVARAMGVPAPQLGRRDQAGGVCPPNAETTAHHEGRSTRPHPEPVEGRTTQPRVMHPEAGSPERPHPRCLELAEKLREILALGHGVSFRDVKNAGFSDAEIIAFGDEARKIADTLGTRHLAPSPDRMADMIAKAKAPVPNAPPLPEGARENQALFQFWGFYCAARAALLIDPWPGQRERCLDRLRDYLDRLPLLPRDRKQIVMAVAAALQGAERAGKPGEVLEAKV